MSPKEVILAYHEKSTDQARKLAETLRGSGYIFNNVFTRGNDLNLTLFDQINSTEQPVIVLISDNFLKSANCLENMHRFIMEEERKVAYVFVNGTSTDSDSGEEIEVPTVIDRISDMIRYITFWHDKTLEVRGEKNNIDASDTEAFQHYFSRFRSLSNDVGEFLRQLRNHSPVQMSEFEENAFELFFEWMEDQEGWEEFRKKQINSPTNEDEADGEEPATRGQAAEENTILFEEQEPTGSVQYPEAPTEPAAEPEEHIQPVAFELPESEEEISPDESVNETFAMPQEEEPEVEGSAAEMIKEGLDAFEEGRIAEGVALIGQAVELTPEDLELRYHYALMLTHNDRDLPLAIHQLREVIRLNPQHEEAYMLLGKLSEQQHKYREAREYFQKVLELNPRHPDIHYRLAAVMLNHFDDQKELAVDHLLEGADQHADNAEKLFRYAKLLNVAGGFAEKAKKLFEQVLEIYPNHAPSHLELAHIYKNFGEIHQAAAYWNKAKKLKPDLVTPELESEFALPEPPQEPVSSIQKNTQIMEMSEQSAINALIENINQLQALLAEKQKEAQHKESNHTKIVLITGASSGIGKATAELFAAQGYRLILNGRRLERLENLKNNLTETYGAEVKLMPFDITRFEAVEQAWNNLEDEWKAVDVLVNNAGKAKGFSPIHEGELKHWEEMIDTNLKGVLYITRLVSPQMVERKTGHIVNVSSTAGKDAYPNGNVYCATKFAVEALTKTMRLDLHKYGIRVSQVAPGHVEETEFALVRFDGDAERAKIYEDFKPLTSRDVAEAILFMVNRPAHVNVQDILIMGAQQASATVVDRSGR